MDWDNKKRRKKEGGKVRTVKEGRRGKTGRRQKGIIRE